MATKPIKKKTYPLNPICESFPEMSPDQLKELATDIEQNGQIEPCQLDAEGRILDGRSRQTAWLAAITIKPLKVVKWKGKATPEKYLQFVLSRNLHRRHTPMSAAQRAQLVVSLNAKFLAKRGGESATVADSSRQTAKTLTLAKEADVSEKTITNARRIHELGDEEKEKAVIAGTMTQRQALERPRSPTDSQPMYDDPPEDDSFKFDPFGNELPKAVQDTFSDVSVLMEWKNQIDRLRREITEACEKELPIARFIRLQGLTSDLKNAAVAVRFAMPYCLCPYCAGRADKCKACEKAGWMPKDVYTRGVPNEMKWREKK